MATRKKKGKSTGDKVVDIWTAVPTDSKGNYLEAATDETGYVVASAKYASITTYPVKDGQEVGIRVTVQVPPSGGVTWYTNGPPGAQVTISLERIPGSGGHNHGGASTDAAAVGTVSPSSFTLPNGYPQNVRSIFRASEVCGAIRCIWRSTSGNPPVVENLIEVLIQGASGNISINKFAPQAPHPGEPHRPIGPPQISSTCLGYVQISTLRKPEGR